KPTPCRVRFTDGEGKYYAPFGRLERFAANTGVDVGGNVFVGIKEYAYVDGAFEIALPVGTIRVQVEKGPEYLPVDVLHDLPAGKLSMRLAIERWIDARSLGWYSGDTRAHFLTPHAALLETQGEDLAVTNVLVRGLEVEDAFRRRLVSLPNIIA